jgi:hypothetical protein
MVQQNQLKIRPTPHEIAPRPDRSQPPSSNLRGAKKRPARQPFGGLTATFAKSEFELTNCNCRRYRISNRNRNGLSEVDEPNSSAQLQALLEFLIVSQERLEIAVSHSQHYAVAFSNRPKIHDLSYALPAPLPAESLSTLVLEWGFFHE